MTLNSTLDAGGGQSVEVVREPIYNNMERIYPWLRQPGDVVVALLRARRNLDLAESWRNFRVSACAVTLIDEAGTASYLQGVNRKTEDESIDAHAEETVIEGVARIARRPISVLALVADVQPDDTTKLATPALTPCYRRCLPQLEALEHMKSMSLIATAPPDMSCVQFYDPATLRRAHEESNPGLLTTVNFVTPYDEDSLKWRAEWRQNLLSPLEFRVNKSLMALTPRELMELNF